MKFVTYCGTASGEKVTWLADVYGRQEIIYQYECKDFSKDILYEACLKKSDSDIYYMNFEGTTSGQYTTASYYSVYNEFNTLAFIIAPSMFPNPPYQFNMKSYINSGDSMYLHLAGAPDNWYTSDFVVDDSWTAVKVGDAASLSTLQYYRVAFTVDHINLIAAYNIGLLFNGNAVAYINGAEVWKGNRIILSASNLKENNILAVSVDPKEETMNKTLSIYLTTQYSTEPNNCAYTLPSYTMYSHFSTSSLSKMFDFKINTYSDLGNNENLDAQLVFKDNTYAQFNAYRFVGSFAGTGDPREYYVAGRDRNSENWLRIDSRDDQTFYPGNATITMYDNLKAYNQLLLYVVHTNTQGLSSRDMQMFTCRQRNAQLAYPYKSYIIPLYVPFNPIWPLTRAVNNVTITPELPAGIYIDPATGRISGIASALSEAKEYTITSLYPISLSTKITLSVTACQGSIIKISKENVPFSVASEAFYVSPENHGEEYDLIMKQEDYSIDTMIKSYYFYRCVSSSLINITMANHKPYTQKWSSESRVRIAIYPYSDYTNDTLYTAPYQLLMSESWSEYEGNHYTLNLQPILYGQQEWKTLSDSIPENWYTSSFDDSTWNTVTTGSTTITSSVTLFRKSFSISFDVNKFDVFDLRVLYQEGIAIYINDHLLLSRHIPSHVTTTSLASGNYSELLWRKISFPGTYIQKGTNKIAILLLATTNPVEISYPFDLFMINVGTPYTRAVDLVTSSPRIDDAFDRDITSKATLKDDYIYNFTIQGVNDEYFYLSSYAIANYNLYGDTLIAHWTLQGRQNIHGDESWTTIDTRGDLVWGVRYTKRFFSVEHHDTIYNEYRFVDTTSYSMKTLDIAEIYFYSHSIINTVPSFIYLVNDTTSYRGVYLSELLPESCSQFHDYSISPNLPEGLIITKDQGAIRGIPTVTQERKQYTITAKNYLGESVHTTMYITIIECNGDNSLFILDLFYYNNYKAAKFDLYYGLESSYRPIDSVGSINYPYSSVWDPRNTSLMIRTYPYCLPSGYYQFGFSSNDGMKWILPAGYSIHNEDYTSIKMGSVRSTDRRVTEYFDSSVAIQKDVTKWSYLVTDDMNSDWIESDYDISKWKIAKGSSVECLSHKYIFLRSMFSIYNVTSHSSLDFKFTAYGDVRVFINSVLYYSYSREVDKLEEHTFSLITQGAYVKNRDNVICVEITTHSAVTTVPFYMNTAYTLSSCTRLFTQLVATPDTKTVVHDVNNLFDFNFFSLTQIESSDTQTIYVTFTSQEPPLFNSLHLQLWNTSYPISISIQGRSKENTMWRMVLGKTLIKGSEIGSIYIPVPKGVTKLRYLSITFNEGETASSILLSELSFAYCNYENMLCPSLDNFPSVGEGEYSYSLCEDGYDGYMYRYCDGLKLGKIKRDQCLLMPPTSITYPHNIYTFYTYMEIQDIIPTVRFIVTSFIISPSLPKGLSFNTTTGVISGMPQTSMSNQKYTVVGSNIQGSVNTTFTLNIYQSSCSSIGSYPPTFVGEETVIGCESGYFGERRRKCEYINNNIQWADAEEQCTSIIFVSISVLFVVSIITVILLLVIMKKMEQKKKVEIQNLRKARGGVVSEKRTDHEPLQI
ncbi:hypothetical protein WA158_000895 [Blastocystis sp. Blastoise]